MSDRHGDPYVRTVARHSAEDSRRARVNEIAERLLVGMGPGTFKFPVLQYRALALYLLDGEGVRLQEALDSDSFKITSGAMRVTIKRERGGPTVDLVTLSEFAKLNGLSQSTVWRKVNRAKLDYSTAGNRKLYDIEELNAVLFTD